MVTTIFCDYCCTLALLSVMHTTPFLHMQQELVTSRILPEFAEEITEVAEGGEMVRKEAGRKVEGRQREGEKGERKEYIIMINFCSLDVMERWLCSVKVQMHSI